jgi:ferrous iron transport protein A
MIIILNKRRMTEKDVNKMTLVDGKAKQTYTVHNIQLAKEAEIRLKALGLTDGTKIEVLNNKRGGSVIFSVRGTRLAVGKKIAEAIHIEEN